MRIVVTGATGNVGTSVVEALAADPAVDSVLGLARRLPALEVPKVTWAAADVSSSDLEPHFRGADAVIHLAWLIQPSHRVDVLEATNVEGTARVLAAMGRTGVRTLVYASSVGAYSAGPKDRPVDESWPTAGVPTSFYARHKAATERLLDGFEETHPDARVVRLRPALIFKREAAWGIRKVFVGRLLPGALLRPERIPVVPRHPRLVFQALHTRDAAEAYRLALLSDARGPFNVAADPVLDGEELGRILGARPVPVPGPALRSVVAASWHLRLQPTTPGWIDLALGVPVLDTSRIRRELGWQPTVTSGDALRELLDGLADGAGAPTPPLEPETPRQRVSAGMRPSRTPAVEEGPA
ncbi:MAG TPA: NAD-dependent epimerase/dehydratase family protein [Acidimicrobiales bacterium]|nr:NAD-dependent epimerase/dehydratase family protein [Acidimicrobiales bacterium]